jgi:hypothetical protein
LQNDEYLNDPAGRHYDWRLTNWSSAVRNALGGKALLLFRGDFVVLLAPAVVLAAYSLYANSLALMILLLLSFWGGLGKQSESDWDRDAREHVRGDHRFCVGVHFARQAGRLFLYASGSYLVRLMCNSRNNNVVLERSLAKIQGLISNTL